MKVMVVDDEPFILRSLTYVLRKEGFDVHEAHNGREALEVFEREKPQLVFLDVMMPEMNGFEVCREIKGKPENQDVGVVMLTARGQDTDRSRGLSAGANEYLTKPFSPTKVVELARKFATPKPPGSN